MHSQRIRSSVKPQTPSQPPVRGARVLFDGGARHPVRRFGSGVLPYVPYCGTRPYTAQDEQWWAQESNQPERVLYTAIRQEMAEMEREADMMAEEAAWQDSYEAGYSYL